MEASDGQDRLLGSAPDLDPEELGAQVAVLLADGRPGGGDQGATWVQPCDASHSASPTRPLVVVAKLRTSRCRGSETQRTPATTTSLWTSSPAQRGHRTSIDPLLAWLASARSPRRRSLLGVLRGLAARGNNSGCSSGSGSNY